MTLQAAAVNTPGVPKALVVKTLLVSKVGPATGSQLAATAAAVETPGVLKALVVIMLLVPKAGLTTVTQLTATKLGTWGLSVPLRP